MKYFVLVGSLLALASGCKDPPRDIAVTEQLSLSQRCNKDNAQDDPECRDMNPGTLAPGQPAQPVPPKAAAPTKAKTK